MAEYESVTVKPETYEEFESVRRELQYMLDTDLTQDVVLNILLHFVDVDRLEDADMEDVNLDFLNDE